MLALYTDGSCHTRLRIGAWAVLLVQDNEVERLFGLEKDTTHQRMELKAVIEALAYIQKHWPPHTQLTVYTDSQYVIGLVERMNKLIAANLTSKAGSAVPNADLVRRLYSLLPLVPASWVKLKAHQQKGTVHKYNLEADKLARLLVREAVKQEQG